ncbi:hypothetical protein LMG6003_05956 [Achromobacter insolitus]|nr:hypothetical protein LMG6003_05956 [Achromobacter insolitus]
MDTWPPLYLARFLMSSVISVPVSSVFSPCATARSLLAMTLPASLVSFLTSIWKPPSPARKPVCSMTDLKSLCILPALALAEKLLAPWQYGGMHRLSPKPALWFLESYLLLSCKLSSSRLPPTDAMMRSASPVAPLRVVSPPDWMASTLPAVMRLLVQLSSLPLALPRPSDAPSSSVKPFCLPPVE